MTETQASVSSHPNGKAVHRQMIAVPTRFDTTASLSPIPSFKDIRFLKIETPIIQPAYISLINIEEINLKLRG